MRLKGAHYSLIRKAPRGLLPGCMPVSCLGLGKFSCCQFHVSSVENGLKLASRFLASCELSCAT